MNFGFKDKQQVTWILGLSGFLLLCVFAALLVNGDVWTRFDWQLLDRIYRHAAQSGRTPAASSNIVYLTIDDGTYRSFHQNSLDRGYLARVNEVLTEVGAQAVAYDIIFAYPSEPTADQDFAKSLQDAGMIYLPIGYKLALHQASLAEEIGGRKAQPFYALRSLEQLDLFTDAAYGSGHISMLPDSDGIFRHQIMLIKQQDRYVPTLSLAMFLDDIDVPLELVDVNWGRSIRIPAGQSPYLERDVLIPIDTHGRASIPFPAFWGQDFENMPAHELVQHFQDLTLQGNLESFFSGKFVFIADIARGADIGQTPLEQNVPLVSTHAAMLSGLLTNSFYRQWPVSHVIAIICVLTACLIFTALLRSSRLFYAAGGILLLLTVGSTWLQFFRFILFPAVTVGGSLLFLFAGLGIGVEVSKRAFILGAFSHYVPEGVVKELLKHPEALKLGGEKRTITMLFSDVRGFTSISEKMSPEELVALLNEYLTEMTAIVLETGGIIDKYEGDAIMAEFGAPLPLPDHADRAVATALAMQRRLRELREQWAERNLPELSCRIGINSGEVVLGNMGSDQMFDYTVMGDDVNLASRLEGANKNYNTFLMISEATYNDLTPGRFRTRALDLIKVKGKSRAVKVFEVYGGASDEIDAEALRYYQSYQDGFEAYLRRDFTRALTLFANALELRPNDPASKWLVSRIVEINPDELPEEWEGSVELTSK